MNKIIFVFVPMFVFSFSFIISPVTAPLAHAETYITDNTDLSLGAVWTKEGSPYIISTDAYIPYNQTLYIGPGVTVMTSSSTSAQDIFISGTLVVDGTANNPVTIKGLTSFSIMYSTSTISHAIISVPTGIAITKSTVDISSSTITGAKNGISAYASTINIRDSIFSGNNYGIYSYYLSPGPFLMFNNFGNFLKNIFEVKTANAQTTQTTQTTETVDDVPGQNHIYISNSSITGNSTYGIFNAITNPVHAENNWWGNENGPASSTTGSVDAVSGTVDYNPWLTADPTIKKTATACCSNVLFLPGLEGSRLYMGTGQSKNQLWEPNRNADVQKLFMTSSGQSVNSGIYTKDVLDSAFGLYSIYKGFITMMNSVVAEKTINSWQAYPYDWRYDVGTVVSPALVNAVQTLASTSKTGKVTIVAHSDGGLVAKLLAKTLADRGESALLDKVIMVAVPQFGTPQAVAGILHGDGESMLGGLLLDQSTARQLGVNMPGGYGLLPSKAYFSGGNSVSNFLAPVIAFATSTIADFHFTGDSQTISAYNSLRNFLAGISDHRTAPADSDTDLPAVLHTAMIDASQKIHDTIDSFSFASTTQEIVLAGWGKATLAGISYYEKISCSGNEFTQILGMTSTCTKSLEHTTTTTLFGDDTVVMGSADTGGAQSSASNSSEYYFDIGSESKGKLIGDGHSTILSTDSAVAFVKDQIEASSSLPPYISSHRPTMADLHNDDLTVSVHSPVALNMYDSQGRHTGPIPNPVAGSDLGAYETGIPGSSYIPNDGDTSITVPYSTDYRVTFSGTGMGSFEVDTAHNVNGADVSGTTFADMPVTPLLQAQLILATTTLVQTSATSTSTAISTTTTATTTQMIVFDFDGDGTIDATTTPHTTYDPVLDTESMQAIVTTLNLSPFKEKIMHDKLLKIIELLKEKKPIKAIKNPNTDAVKQAEQAMSDLKNQHWVFKNLDSTRKQKLEDIFQAILDNVDITNP